MAQWQKPIYFSKNTTLFNNLKVLQKFYNINTNTKLLEHIIDNEIEKSKPNDYLKELHEIYNTKNDIELIDHLIKLELKRQGIN